MCRTMEEMLDQCISEERRGIAHALILTGELSNEKIAEVTKLPLEEIEELAVDESKAYLALREN